MFYGQHAHTLDSKNRLTIPAKFRELVEKEGGTLHMTRGFEKCLSAYTPSQWAEVVARINAPGFAKSGGRPFQRLFFANAATCELDSHGRILIPEHLKTEAGLGRDVVLLGVATHVEVWDQKNWEAYRTSQAGMFEKSAEELLT